MREINKPWEPKPIRQAFDNLSPDALKYIKLSFERRDELINKAIELEKSGESSEDIFGAYTHP